LIDYRTREKRRLSRKIQILNGNSGRRKGRKQNNKPKARASDDDETGERRDDRFFSSERTSKKKEDSLERKKEQSKRSFASIEGKTVHCCCGKAIGHTDKILRKTENHRKHVSQHVSIRVLIDLIFDWVSKCILCLCNGLIVYMKIETIEERIILGNH